MGQMEIRIILDRAEPPAGRLRAVPDPAALLAMLRTLARGGG